MIEKTWNRSQVEGALRRVEARAKAGDNRPGRVGLRAAEDRNGRLLAALEDIAEELDQVAEAQWGRTRRSADTEAGKRMPTTASLYREAYRLADEGRPEPGLMAQYGAAAILCGMVD